MLNLSVSSGTELRLRQSKLSGPPAGKGSYVYVVALLLPLLIFAANFNSLCDLPVETLAMIASIVVMSVAVMVFVSAPRGIWSASCAYFIVFGLFHFGLLFTVALGKPAYDQRTPYVYLWFYTDYTKVAIVLASMGVLACGLGIQAGYIASRHRWSGQVMSPLAFSQFKPAQTSTNTAVQFTGFIILLASIGAWFAVVVLGGGLGLLVGSYIQFLLVTATSTLVIALADYGIGLGLVFLSASGASRMRAAGFGIFGLWSLLAFPLGLRGEVLFPGITALVLLARTRPPLSTMRTIMLGICLLSLIALVKDYRQVGLSGIASAEIGASPVGALMELGSSLRPVAEVVNWREQGDEFLYGASYWAPIDRLLVYVLPGWRRTAAVDDQRLQNIVVRDRVGPIGFSPVAEGYRNFGVAGVVLVMFLTGIIVSALDSIPNTLIGRVVAGLILVELFIQVRNDFTALPAHIICGLVLLRLVIFFTPNTQRYPSAPL